MVNLGKYRPAIVIIALLIGCCGIVGATSSPDIPPPPPAFSGIETPPTQETTAPEGNPTAPTVVTPVASPTVASPVVGGIKTTQESYLGVVTGTDVYIRSGPAQVYYSVGKLQKDQQVIVLGERRGIRNWAKIAPTPQCFSYISKRYVQIQELSGATATPESSTPEAVSDGTTTSPLPSTAESPTTAQVASSSRYLRGIVTGNYVKVRAGSVKVPPINARQVQTLLNKGAVVQIIGERDDYYKIVSPKDSFFWVALDYIKRVGPVPQAIVDTMRPETDPCAILSNPPVQISDKSLERAQLNQISQLYKTEQEKPLKQRDYAPIKEKLETFLAEAQSASVQNSAKLLLDSLARAEMALEAFKRSLDQDERLRLTLAQIDQKVQNLVATKSPPGKTEKDLVIEGTLAPSSVFTAPFKNRRFLVLDENEDIIYYAIAGTEGVDLTPWIGKKVSLVGKPRFDTFGKTRIINVTGIVELTGEK